MTVSASTAFSFLQTTTSSILVMSLLLNQRSHPTTQQPTPWPVEGEVVEEVDAEEGVEGVDVVEGRKWLWRRRRRWRWLRKRRGRRR
jgi:hypothetical protein